MRRSGRARSGYTLTELLAVILIIGILAAALLPMIGSALDTADVSACTRNLEKVYGQQLVYEIKVGRKPDEVGVRFLAQPIARGVVESSKTNAEALSCPGVDRGALAEPDLALEERWTDLERLDGGWSTYAGRDAEAYPLRRRSGAEAIAADDNDGGANHHSTTNVLYADGSVQSFEVGLLREDGLLPPDAETLVVGPDSPVAALRKLSLD